MAGIEKSPDAFRTISEVARWLETPAHVLRFWESRFDEVSPVKRAGGRRYYRPEDMQLLGGIKHLLHDEGRTIKAVQELIGSEGTPAVAAFSQPLPAANADAVEDAGDPETDSAGSDQAEAAPEAEPTKAAEADIAEVVDVPVETKSAATEAQPEIESEPPEQPQAAAEETIESAPDSADMPLDDSPAEDATEEAAPAAASDEEPPKKRRSARSGFIFDDSAGFMQPLTPSDVPVPEVVLPVESEADQLDLASQDPEDDSAPGAPVLANASVLRELTSLDTAVAAQDALIRDAIRRLRSLRGDPE